MVDFGLNQRLHSITGGTVPITDAVYDVIAWAISHDQLSALCDAALEDNPTASFQKAIADLHLPPSASAPAFAADLATA